jgi:hypothetical protein
VINQGEHRPCLLEQNAARVGQLHAVTLAVEQRSADHLLQPTDLLAQRWLRDEHRLRRMGERASIGDCHQIPQMPQLDAMMGVGRRSGKPIGSGALAHYLSLAFRGGGQPLHGAIAASDAIMLDWTDRPQ